MLPLCITRLYNLVRFSVCKTRPPLCVVSTHEINIMRVVNVHNIGRITYVYRVVQNVPLPFLQTGLHQCRVQRFLHFGRMRSYVSTGEYVLLLCTHCFQNVPSAEVNRTLATTSSDGLHEASFPKFVFAILLKSHIYLNVCTNLDV